MRQPKQYPDPADSRESNIAQTAKAIFTRSQAATRKGMKPMHICATHVTGSSKSMNSGESGSEYDEVQT